MSYELIFLGGEDINVADFKEHLNPNIKDNEKGDRFRLSKEFKKQVQNELTRNGLKFKPYEVADSDEVDLAFSSYNVCLGYSDISITVPYFKENLSTKVEGEILKIIAIFNDLDLHGYNPQTEALLTGEYKFKSEFSNTKVNLSYFHNDYTAFLENRRSKKGKRFKLIYNFMLICLAIYGLYKLIVEYI